MEFHDLMEQKDVFFFGLTEPEVNVLRLYFSRSKISDTPEPLIVLHYSAPLAEQQATIGGLFFVVL